MHAVFPPYFRKRFLLTKAERSFYEILRDIAHDHFVLAKVRLADLINASDRHRYWQANFNRVCSKHIDFVICDSLFRPKVAIELDDSSHAREDRRRRDSDLDRLFKAVSFPLLHVQVRRDYDSEELSELLFAKLKR